MKTLSEAKKKKTQDSAEYRIRIYSKSDKSIIVNVPHMSKTFSNEAMKPSRLLDHFNKMHSDMKGKDVTYFQNMEKKYVVELL